MNDKYNLATFVFKFIIVFVVTAVCSCFIEFAISNHFYWFNDLYSERVVTLPSTEGRNEIQLTNRQPTLSLQGIEIPANQVEICARGTSGIQKFQLFFSDAINKTQLIPAALITLNPGGEEKCTIANLNPKGSISNFAIKAIELKEAAVFITKFTFNPKYELKFSLVRFFLISIVVFIVLASVIFKIWAKTYDIRNFRHNALTLSVLVGAIFFSCLLICMEGSSRGEKSIFYIGGSSVIISREDGKLTQPIPNGEILARSDIYTQLFSALKSGQFNLQLQSDPKILELNNPYDTSERSAVGVSYYWDHAWKDGKYFCYYGPAPLLIAYLPLYILTGELPLPILATGIMGICALIALYAAMMGLIKYFALTPNLLILLLLEGAILMGGSLTTMLQVSATFYYLPYLSAYIWLGFFIFALYTAFSTENNKYRNLLLIIAGVSVVLIVLSRPLIVVFAVVFSIPVIIRRFTNLNNGYKDLIVESSLIGIPIIVGALLVMYYNYSRFGSVFEFGQYLQLTVTNIQGNEVEFSLRSLMGMLRSFFIEPLENYRNFPFIGLANPVENNAGNYLYSGPHVGILQFPIVYGLALVVLEIRKGVDKELLWLVTGVIVATMLVSYFAYNNAGVHVRYVCDSIVSCSLISFVLVCKWIKYQKQSTSEKILMFIVGWLLLKTCILGALLSFSDENNMISYLNPDGFILLQKLFTPW